MITALAIVALVAVVLALVVIVHQMCTDWVMWACHTCSGSIGFLLELAVKLVAAIWEGFTGSNS